MPGEILAVIGDNGAGKSTLIKALAGAVIPDQGEIRLDGQVVHFTLADGGARGRHRDGLPEPRSVAGALDRRQSVPRPREAHAGLPGHACSASSTVSGMQKEARAALSNLGLMTIQNINQTVETLSGGQRQGVAVARAAAFGSRVIIMDEPTAALGVEGIAQGAGADPRRAQRRACRSC